MASNRLHWIVLLSIILFCNDTSAWRRRRRRCNSSPCQWVWSDCSKTCGGGTQYPIKTVNQGSCGSCNMPSGSRSCNTQCCRLDCAWNDWGSWGTCSRSCGNGIQLRARGQYGPSCGGTPCQGVSEEQRECNTQCCPVDCKWTSWEPVGTCSATCGGGLQLRNRTEEIMPSCSGKSCEGSTEGNIDCNTQCCPVNCQWEEWGVWSACSKSCGGGSRTRIRNVALPHSCGGQQCEGPSAEDEICNSQCCVIDCLWGEWSSWSSCTKTCDTGEEGRDRSIAVSPQCGGEDCSGEICDTRPCNEFCCPSQCDYSTWSQWTECDKTCESGSQTRQRTVSTDLSCSSQNCTNPLYEDRVCNTQCCPVDCVLSQWSQWSECSKTCGSDGSQVRQREILTEPECGGKTCDPDLVEQQDCNRFCFREESVLTSSGCICAEGWKGECCESDVDECEYVTCTNHSTCINSEGSYECVCNHNYTKEGDLCLHYDKCATDRDDCNDEAQCTMINYEEYTCQCFPGFKGNGYICEDIDECSTENEISGSGSGFEDSSGEIVQIVDRGNVICDPNADCINTYGSFYCQCNVGFIGDGFNCTDADECTVDKSSTDAANCSDYALCENTIGSYHCWCNAGYYGDGIDCTEIDECESNPCENGGLCTDLVDGFSCQCKQGYNGTTCTADLNECVNGMSTCDSVNGECFNLVGSYGCQCKGGYEGDGRTCTDIDECALGIDDCGGTFPLCVNKPGYYVCECEPGTIRDDDKTQALG